MRANRFIVYSIKGDCYECPLVPQPQYGIPQFDCSGGCSCGGLQEVYVKMPLFDFIFENRPDVSHWRRDGYLLGFLELHLRMSGLDPELELEIVN